MPAQDAPAVPVMFGPLTDRNFLFTDTDRNFLFTDRNFLFAVASGEGVKGEEGATDRNFYRAGGRDFVVIACGGGKIGVKSGDRYVAFSLPE